MNTIIKPIYLFIGAAMILSACSQDDIPGQIYDENRQIIFRTTLPVVTGRSEVVKTENLEYFNVTAFDPADPSKLVDDTFVPNFTDKCVKIDNSRKLYSSSECLWPEQGMENHNLTFLAYYPSRETLDAARFVNKSTSASIICELENIRIKKNIADQFDFITGKASGSMATNLFSGITLPFAHQLCQIEVKAYGAHKSCDIEIAGIRFGGVGVKGTFALKTDETAGEWDSTRTEKGIVEYIYDNGDTIVSLPTASKSNAIAEIDNAISIMGANRNGKTGNAMLIPSTYAKWDAATDRRNTSSNMFISVLLRITDTTPSSKDKADTQRYPYHDISQGADALKIPVVYLAVNKESGVVSTRLYKKNDNYYTDEACETAYTHPDNLEIKEFGWAALPVDGTLAPGYKYTYNLNYTFGIGLHDPEINTESPAAGDPVISDKVGFSCSVKEWKFGGGDKFDVPGS